MWAQEEPRNQGAYSFVKARCDRLAAGSHLGGRVLGYVGRPAAATSATASPAVLRDEEAAIARGALDWASASADADPP